MRHIVIAALFSTLFTAAASAGWWAENDYVTGSNGLKSDSLTVFTNVSKRIALGANAAFYKDKSSYRDAVYSYRLPAMYSGDAFFLSFKPFVYPVSAQTRSGAAGGKVYLLTSAKVDNDESYLHLSVAGAWATKPSGVSNATLVTPVLDHSDMAYLGTFRPVTALPEWSLSAQVARSMKPDFDSHIYAGYSKISYRSAKAANSGIFGLKLGLTEKSTLDLAYNLYKEEGAARKNYYKILLQVFF
jgi:hypothetical protein